MKVNPRRQHSKNLENLFQRPHIINLKPIVLAKEVRFYYPNGDIYAEPDLLALTEDYLINVEYKCTNLQKDKAIKQLLKIENHLRYLGYQGPIKNLFIFDEYKIEEID